MDTQPLIYQLFFCGYAFKANTDGITHEESLKAPEVDGNCLNFVAGHLVSARGGILQVLGRKALLSPEEDAIYKRGASRLDPAAAVPFDRLREDFARGQELIVAGLEEISPEALAKKAPMSVGKGEEETVGSLLTMLIFHDAYHVGQTGLLRRVLGKPGAIT